MALCLCDCGKVEVPREKPSRVVREKPALPAPVMSSESVEDTVAIESSSEEELPLVESSSSKASKSRKGKSRSKKQGPVMSSSAEVDSIAALDTLTIYCKGELHDAICDPRDGDVYRTVHIGSQVWMAENLRFEVDGSWCYGDNSDNCRKYGRLYSWTSAVHVNKSYRTAFAKGLLNKVHRGLCPKGWHLPSSAEMKKLSAFIEKENAKRPGLTESVGTSLKSRKDWTGCDANDEECAAGTNRYGFNARPAGRRNADGTYDDLRRDAGFWIAEESDNASHARYWDLYYATDKFWGDYTNSKSVGYSVRCLKD